jgi:hypothetical protein
MTVLELIDALRAFPPDQLIAVRDNTHPNDADSRNLDKVVAGFDPADGEHFVIIEVE